MHNRNANGRLGLTETDQQQQNNDKDQTKHRLFGDSKRAGFSLQSKMSSLQRTLSGFRFLTPQYIAGKMCSHLLHVADYTRTILGMNMAC